MQHLEPRLCLIIVVILHEELKVEGTKTAVTYKILNGDWEHSSLAVDSLEVANMEWEKG